MDTNTLQLVVAQHGETLALLITLTFFSAQVVLGLLLADFVSGLLHWMEDRYGGPNWPVIGPIIRSTIRHHHRPRRMVGVGFMRRNGPTAGIALGFLVFFALIGALNPITITAVLAGAMANEFHNWAHRKESENGPIITALQRCGLIVSPMAHAAHHRGFKNTNYCAVNGWMNPVLEHIRFWRRLEAVIRVVTRYRPRRDPTVKRRWLQRQ